MLTIMLAATVVVLTIVLADPAPTRNGKENAVSIPQFPALGLAFQVR
jgi:hypothetical protein